MLRLSPVSRLLSHAAVTVLALSLLPSQLALAADEAITAKREGTQIVFRAGTNEVARYQAEPGDLPRADIKKEFSRGGYLHPIRTPSGRVVTDDYPSDHIHHHGVWFAWTKTEFEGRTPDFWNMGQGKGRVEFVAVDKVWEKEATAGLTARHKAVDLLAQPAKTALDETWEVTVARGTGQGGVPVHIIDLTSTNTCATDAPLGLPKYHYGGLGFRGNRAWNGPAACKFLTSEGETDRKKGNETRGKWCWIGGTVDGQIAGVTILCHPENFRFPEPMRLNPTEPFFCFAPQQLGHMEIKPGSPYISRYRIIASDGDVTREQADAWWNEWTAGK